MRFRAFVGLMRIDAVLVSSNWLVTSACDAVRNDAKN